MRSSRASRRGRPIAPRRRATSAGGRRPRAARRGRAARGRGAPGRPGLHEGQAPPADVHELEHSAEGDPEEERPCDGEDSRAELVRPLLDEHAPDQLGRLGVQPIMVHERFANAPGCARGRSRPRALPGRPRRGCRARAVPTGQARRSPGSASTSRRRRPRSSPGSGEQPIVAAVTKPGGMERRYPRCGTGATLPRRLAARRPETAQGFAEQSGSVNHR